MYALVKLILSGSKALVGGSLQKVISEDLVAVMVGCAGTIECTSFANRV